MRQPHPRSPKTEPPARMRSGSARRKKYANLTVRLLPEDHARIEVEAARAGLSLGGYVRVHLSTESTIRAARRAPVDTEMLARVLAQLGRVGGNLHQLVKHLNFGDATALGDASEVLAELREIGASIMGALGRPPRHDH